MRSAYVKTIYELGKRNERVFCLVADIGEYLLRNFKRDFPGRFLNVGVAEANMIGIAAGLALCKKIPFVYTIAHFMAARCYEQIKMDLCYQKLNVNIVGVGGGFGYSTVGPSHHSVIDIAIMRVLPNMVVLVPSDPIEAAMATQASVEYEGPVYIRMGLTGENIFHKPEYRYKIGKADILREGKDISLISCGSVVNNILKAAEILAKEGIEAKVINMHTVKPIDSEAVIEAMEETRAIITLEEHSIIGGLGGAVAEVLSETKGKKVLFSRMGLKDTFCCDYGSRDYLYKKYGLSTSDIVAKAKEMVA